MIRFSETLSLLIAYTCIEANVTTLPTHLGNPYNTSLFSLSLMLAPSYPVLMKSNKFVYKGTRTQDTLFIL